MSASPDRTVVRRRKPRWGFFVGLALCAALSAPATSASAAWTIRDLGTLGGSSTRAFAINDQRQIVGESDTKRNASRHAFLWAGGRMQDLGTLGGANSSARDINSAGQVTGVSDLNWAVTPEDASPATRNAFIWTSRTMRALPNTVWSAPEEDCNGENTAGEAINDAGHVAGIMNLCSGEPHTLLFDGEAMRRLAEFVPKGMNNADQIVGRWFDYPVGYLWSDETLTYVPGLNGSPDGVLPEDINDQGVIVGSSSSTADVWEGPWHAFRVQGTAVRDLGTLGGTDSQAQAVNGSGLIVGSSEIAGDLATHAFMATPSGSMVDLNTLLKRGSGWVLHTATDVNSSGDIIGVGVRAGRERAFLLSAAK